MNARHLKAADFVRQPWKNGGGITTELAACDEGGHRVWRLSLADVAESGPFSDFTGYERTIMLVEGAGMELALEGRATAPLHQRYVPFVFDGAIPAHCTLVSGPVKDLNLMVRREQARGGLEVIEPHHVRGRSIDARWTLAYALRGWTRISAGDGQWTLAPGELLRFDDAVPAPLDLVGLDREALVALARIHPL